MQQVVKFRLGGVDREVKATIDLALKIEAATGRGLLDLGRDLMADRAPLAVVFQILSVALASSGQKYTDRDMRKMAERDGLRNIMTVAAVLVSEFFREPEHTDDAGPAEEGNE